MRVNHTWRSGQFCRFFSFTMSRSQASSTSSSAPSWLQEFISAVTTQTNLAREHAARSDRTIEDLMERLDKQELRHQQVVDALQKQVAAAGATPLPGAAPSSSLPTSQPYSRLPSPPPPPKLTPDISLRDFRAWKATWEDYFELSNGPRLTSNHQLALLRTCLSPDMRATLGQTIPARDNLTDQLDEIAGHFRRQRNVALYRVKFEQRHQEHGETFDHFYVALRELAADADLCGSCLNERLTTRIMAGVASEDLRKKLLAINPFSRLEDVVARCRSEESATNTEAEFTLRPALAVNALTVRRSALTSAVRSAPRTTPSPRRQPASTPPATKTVCRFCGGRPHQTRSECPAYGTKCTACNRLHHFADVCESRHNPLPSQSQDTVSPHTADVDACSPAPVDDLVAVHQDAGHSNQLHVRHIATHRRHTTVKPDRSGKPLPTLTLHSEVRIRDPHTKTWDQCGTIVRIGARRAYRVQLPSGRGCWRKRRSLRPLPDFSEPPQRCRQ